MRLTKLDWHLHHAPPLHRWQFHRSPDNRLTITLPNGVLCDLKISGCVWISKRPAT